MPHAVRVCREWRAVGRWTGQTLEKLKLDLFQRTRLQFLKVDVGHLHTLRPRHAPTARTTRQCVRGERAHAVGNTHVS